MLVLNQKGSWTLENMKRAQNPHEYITNTIFCIQIQYFIYSYMELTDALMPIESVITQIQNFILYGIFSFLVGLYYMCLYINAARVQQEKE